MLKRLLSRVLTNELLDIECEEHEGFWQHIQEKRHAKKINESHIDDLQDYGQVLMCTCTTEITFINVPR